MRQLVISCSLSPNSRSALLAQALRRSIESLRVDVEWIDLREFELPFCDAGSCYGHSNVIRLKSAIEQANPITIATPIYNYGVGGATRNLVALTGDSWTGKVVSFVAAAGGERSYMAVMGLANSLMLDFRCVIVPRYVYASKASFSENEIIDAEVLKRIDGLAADVCRFGQCLSSA